MSTEVWKDAIGYEGRYQISSFGRVKTVERYIKLRPTNTKLTKIKERIRILRINTNGYFCVSLLDKDGIKKLEHTHRMLAKAFIPNPGNKPCVNHKDGNPLNNHIDNLEWVTVKENTVHAHKMGLVKTVSGEKHHSSKLTNEQIKEIRDKYQKGVRGFGMMSIAKMYKISDNHVFRIVNNKARLKG